MNALKKYIYIVTHSVLFTSFINVHSMDFTIDPAAFDIEPLKTMSCKELNRLASCLHAQHFFMGVLISSITDDNTFNFRQDIREATAIISKSASLIMKKLLIPYGPHVSISAQEGASRIFCTLNYLCDNHPLDRLKAELEAMNNPDILLPLQKIIDVVIEFKKMPTWHNTTQAMDACGHIQETIHLVIKKYWGSTKFFLPYYEHTMAELRAKTPSLKRHRQSPLLYNCCYTSRLYLPPCLLEDSFCKRQPPTGKKLEHPYPPKKNHKKSKNKQQRHSASPIVTQKKAMKVIIQAPVETIALPIIPQQRLSASSELAFENTEKVFRFQQEWFARIKAAIHDTVSLQATLREMHHEYKSLRPILDPVLELHNTHISNDSFFDMRHIRKVLMLTLTLPNAQLKSKQLAHSLKSVLDSAYSDEAQTKELISTLHNNGLEGCTRFYPHSPCLQCRTPLRNLNINAHTK